MSEVQDVLNSRRTVYKFTKQKVEQDKINQALLAASNAPCHKHTHPWKFFIMGNLVRQELIPTITKLANEKSQKNKSPDLAKDVQRAVDKIILPPVIIAVASKKTPSDDFREKEDYAASVCALQNLVLSFWDNGIGSQWTTGAITRHEETYSALGIDSNKWEIIGFVKSGYPAAIPKISKLSVDEISVYLD
jgi:nitroreductase